MTYKYTVQTVTIRGDLVEIMAEPRGRQMRFVPGQYAILGFVQNGRPSAMRCFSIIGDGSGSSIRFGLKITGNFTRALASLGRGDELRIKGPFGTFFIDSSTDRRIVMLASGIGITPFVSMLHYPTAIPTTLLYSNRSAAAIPFYDELRDRARQNPNLEIGFFASADLAGFDDVIPGRIDERFLRRITTDAYVGSTYFICGSQAFSETVERYLKASGVPEDRIVIESFAAKSNDIFGWGQTANRWVYGLAAATLAVGTIGIMGLDLNRAVPKLTAHAAASTQPSQQTSRSSSTDDSNENTQSTTPTTTPTQTSTNNSSSTNSTANNNASSTTNTPHMYYQPPVSSVS